MNVSVRMGLCSVGDHRDGDRMGCRVADEHPTREGKGQPCAPRGLTRRCERSVSRSGVRPSPVCSYSGVGGADIAQDIAASGNGATGDANASGGAIAIGDLDSVDSAESGISVGDIQVGSVDVDAGGVTGGLSLLAGPDGAVVLTDASGGKTNFAFTAQERRASGALGRHELEGCARDEDRESGAPTDVTAFRSPLCCGEAADARTKSASDAALHGGACSPPDGPRLVGDDRRPAAAGRRTWSAPPRPSAPLIGQSLAWLVVGCWTRPSPPRRDRDGSRKCPSMEHERAVTVPTGPTAPGEGSSPGGDRAATVPICQTKRRPRAIGPRRCPGTEVDLPAGAVAPRGRWSARHSVRTVAGGDARAKTLPGHLRSVGFGWAGIGHRPLFHRNHTRVRGTTVRFDAKL